MSLMEILQKLGPILRPYRVRFLIGVVLILLSTGTEMVLPILIGKSVDAVMLGRPGLENLNRFVLIYALIITVRAVIDTIQAYVIQVTGQNVMHDLRVYLFAKIESLPVPYFDKNPTGRLLTRVMNDIKSLSELFTASFTVLALDAMVILGTLVAMFFVHVKLAVVTLMTFPLAILTIKIFGERLQEAYQEVRRRLSEINAFLGENIGAIATIQRLVAEKNRMGRFTEIVSVHQDAQLHSLSVFAMVQPYANILNGVATATLLGVGGYWVVRGEVAIGTIVAFLGYLRNLFQPIRDLVEKYNTFLSAQVSAERVVRILDEDSEREQGHAVPSGTPLDVVFDNVDFKYESRTQNAASDISFTVKEGKSLAVVGATGSGKTTLIRLLLRFYQPTKGKVLVGGMDIEEWDLKALRKIIGVVHQDIYLFAGSIRENLTLGRENFTDSFLIEQLKRVELWSFLENRGGLDVQLYEGGTNLSVGERQLLSFARILVFNPPILILDEATSSIDRILEKKVMDAVGKLIRGRTSIVIAHRLSTIERCDSILVIEKGRIAERGSYEALLKENGIFKKFHNIYRSA